MKAKRATKISLAARVYLRGIGSKGGKAGSREDKSKAARVRWSKPGARKNKTTLGVERLARTFGAL